MSISKVVKIPWPMAGLAVAEAPANGFWNRASMIRSTMRANLPKSSR